MGRLSFRVKNELNSIQITYSFLMGLFKASDRQTEIHRKFTGIQNNKNYKYDKYVRMTYTRINNI